MLVNKSILTKSFNQGFYLVDNQVINDILYPFALDEWLTKRVINEHIPVVHLWTHNQAFVLGMRDIRLPNAKGAIKQLVKRNYDVMIRNSGGAAVPLDKGILNISIIMPLMKKESIKIGYEIMYQLIKNTLHSINVQKGEIDGSFCPGDYDLSIGGQKFCGISQRRWKNAYVVQAFILVEGLGEERAKLTKKFYQIASNGKEGSLTFTVESNKMISLAEKIDISVKLLKENLIKELENIGNKKMHNIKAESSIEIQHLMNNLKEKYN